MRTFVAVEMPPALRSRLTRLQQSLSERLPPGCMRWVRPDGMHVTLKFLGEISTRELAAVVAALREHASEVDPFSLGVGGLDCFPNPNHPKVVWVNIADAPAMFGQLRDTVEAAAVAAGLAPDNKPFRPHVTLGRVQRRASKSDVRRIGQVVRRTPLQGYGTADVSRFALMKSDLQPGGAVYTALEHFAFEK